MLFLDSNILDLVLNRNITFIQSHIQPVLTYNIELWYNAATDEQKDNLQEPFIRNGYFLDTKFHVDNSVLELAHNYICNTQYTILHQQEVLQNAQDKN